MNEQTLKKLFYDNLRMITNVEEKILISTVFLFFYKRGGIEFADFLYKKRSFSTNLKIMLETLNDPELDIKEINNVLVNDAFKNCKITAQKEFDPDKFYYNLSIRNKDALFMLELSKEIRKKGWVK